MEDVMKEISRETNRVLSDEYILWLIRFVSKDAETDNDNNSPVLSSEHGTFCTK